MWIYLYIYIFFLQWYYYTCVYTHIYIWCICIYTYCILPMLWKLAVASSPKMPARISAGGCRNLVWASLASSKAAWRSSAARLMPRAQYVKNFCKANGNKHFKKPVFDFDTYLHDLVTWVGFGPIWRYRSWLGLFVFAKFFDCLTFLWKCVLNIGVWMRSGGVWRCMGVYGSVMDA